LLALIVVYLGFIVLVPQLGGALGFDTASIAEHVSGRSERTVLMEQALAMSLQHPWFGVGWFGFGSGQVAIAADFASTTYAEHAHNLVLNFAAELGWPATLLMCATLFAWTWVVLRHAGGSSHLRFGGLVLLAVAVHSMVEFPLWYAFVLLPVALLVGAMHQAYWPATPVQVGRGIWVVLVALALACCAFITWDYHRVELGFRTLRWEQEGYRVDESTLQKPDFTLFPDFFDYFHFMKMEPREGMTQEQVEFVERMSRRFGFVHVLNNLAEAYTLNGELDKAARTMVSLQRLHPIAYPEYFDYWEAKAQQDARYAKVFRQMPARDSR
jgi:hypothetical protein